MLTVPKASPGLLLGLKKPSAGHPSLFVAFGLRQIWVYEALPAGSLPCPALWVCLPCRASKVSGRETHGDGAHARAPALPTYAYRSCEQNKGVKTS